MSDIQIILTSPSSTTRAFANQARRLSVPVLLHSSPAKPQPLKSVPTEPRARRSLLYHLNTLYLFTKCDFKTFVYPQTTLGLIIAIACSQPISSTAGPSNYAILARLPLAVAWVWMNLLVGCISNQSQPGSTEEDKLNKPWRPLAANRLSHSEARFLFYLSTVATLLLTSFIGGTKESMLVMALISLYNDFGMADAVISRNFINAAAYTMFGLGTATVLTHGLPCSLTTQGYLWLAILAAVIMTTVHCQDLPDQEGDQLKGRRTVPLILGDDVARYLVAGPMIAWTIFALGFWGTKFAGSVMVFAIAGVVVKRLMIGDKEGYRKTFKLYNLWLIALYLLPLMGKRL